MTEQQSGAQTQLSRLQAVVEAIRETLTPDDLDTALSAVVAGVGKVLGEQASAAITLIDDKGKLDPASYRVAGPLAEIMDREKPRPVSGIGAWVVKHNQAVYEEDVPAGEAPNHPPIRKDRLVPAAYACLPLRSQQRVIGTLFVIFQTPFDFTNEIKESLHSFASLAARAVELTRLREASARQKSQQIRTIRQISQKLLETWQELDPVNTLEKTLGDILRQVDEEVISDQLISAIVYVYEEGQGFYSGAARGPLQEYMLRYPPRPGGTGEYTIQTRKPLFVSDIANWPPGVPPLSQQALAHGVKAFANLPLLIGAEGQETPVGLLIINLQEKYEFDENRRAMLRLFANQAAIALQNARVHRRRLREQQAWQAISEAALGGQPEEVGDVIARQAVELTKSSYATLWSADLKRARFELKGTYKTDPYWQPQQSALPIDERSINGYVARTKQPYYAPNVDVDPYYSRWHEGIKSAFCVPLLVGEELIDTLFVASEQENGIAPADQDFIKRLAPHAAVALYNARLLELEQRRNRDLNVLNRSALKLGQILDEEQACRAVLEAAIETLECDSGAVFFIEPDNILVAQTVIGGQGPVETPKLRFAPGEGLAGWVYQQGQALIVNNTAEEGRYRPGRSEKTINPRSIILSPLRRGEQVIGVVSADANRPDAFDENDQRLLDTLTRHAGTVLQNIEFFNEFQALHVAANNLASQPGSEQIYQIAVQSALVMLRCRHSTIFMLDKKAGELVAVDRVGAPQAAPEVRHFKPAEGLAGRVAKTGQSILVNDTAGDPRFVTGKVKPRSAPRSIILAPIKIEDEVIGVLAADKDETDGFTPHNLEVLETLALDVGIAIHLRRQQDRLAAIAKFQQAISNILPEPNLLARIYEEMSGLMDTGSMFIALYDEETNRIRFPLAYERGRLIGDELKTEGRPYSPRLLGARRGLSEWVIERQESLLVQNFETWAGAAGIEEDFRRDLKSCLAAPILIKDNIIGLIGLQNFDQPGVFDEADRSLLLTIAGQAAVALDNARQYDLIDNQLKRRIDELQAVSLFQQQIGGVGTVEQELQEIYNQAAEAMSGLMDTRDMYIALYDEETGIIEFPLGYKQGKLVPDEEKIKDTPYGPRRLGERQGLTEWVIRHKEPLLIERDFDAWVEAQADIEAFPMGTQCWLGAPMVFRDKVIGVIGLQNFEQEGVFDHNHRDLLVTIAGQAAVAIDNARQYDLINHQLARRIAELEAVSRFQQRISSFAVIQKGT